MSKQQRRIVLGVTHAKSLGFLTGLAEQLIADDWDVHIVSSPRTDDRTYPDLAVTIHELPMVREVALWADLIALSKWRKLLKQVNPEVVMVGTPKAGLLGIIGARLAGVPIRVYHLRGLRLESSKGVHKHILMNAERVAFRLATHALAVSNSLRSLVITLGLVEPHKITVLGKGSSKGVNIDRYGSNSNSVALRGALGLRANIPVIGFVGRVTVDKGSNELIRASQLLCEEGIHHQLLVIGGADDKAGIEALLSKQSCCVPILAGRIKDTAPYYGLMDILCLPTHREGFPNVILEAGAAAVPSVTTDATGAIDSVVEGHTGRIVKKGSSAELARVLRELIVEEDSRRRLGTNARRYVAEHYEERNVLKSVSAYLENLLLDSPHRKRSRK